jgi:nucleotide-binding universal stress UspA family protein
MKILFATDGEKQCEAALEMINRFDLRAGDHVRIISVVDMAVPMAFDMYGGSLPDTAEIERNARENAGKLLEATADKLRARFAELEVSSDVLFGSPESRIVEAAEEMRPDLVVVGSHGYSRWERLLLGSVSDSVVHHAPCSVLVVRTPAR